MATPLGLMAMGASFNWEKAGKAMGPALCASAIKLLKADRCILPIAVMAGFWNEQLVAILVMLGSATTVSQALSWRGIWGMRSHFQHRGADHLRKRLYIDLMAVSIRVHGTYMMKETV